MTVANGPEPNAGSRPRQLRAYGNAIATSVAIEQLANSATDTATATLPLPQTADDERLRLGAETAGVEYR